MRATHGKGENERASRPDEEDDSDVEEEGGRGVDDEEGESDLVEDLVEGSGSLEEGNEERVEKGADLWCGRAVRPTLDVVNPSLKQDVRGRSCKGRQGG